MVVVLGTFNYAFLMRVSCVLSVCAVLVSAAVATAHTGATGVTLQRMQGMSALADAMKSLSPMVRGQADHDEQVVAAAAAVLAQHSGRDMVDLFEAGTGMAPSEAAPTVWSNPDGFAQLPKN